MVPLVLDVACSGAPPLTSPAGPAAGREAPRPPRCGGRQSRTIRASAAVRMR